MKFEVKQSSLQLTYYMPRQYIFFFFFFLFSYFFLSHSRNDYFNNKVDYTFGHDNEEDGLNLSFQISYEGHIAYFHDLRY